MKQVSMYEIKEGCLYISYRDYKMSYKEICPFTMEFDNPFPLTMIMETEKYLYSSRKDTGNYIVEECSLNFRDDLENEGGDTIFFELTLQDALDFFDFI